MEKIEVSYNKKNTTKEELKEELKKYKQILNDSMIEYLNSLIELEFSIIKENISDNERLLLSDLEIYKEIANYNISERAFILINSKKDIIELINKKNEEELRIYADIDGDNIILFNFNFIGSDAYSDIDKGNIHLYQTINSVEQIEKEINRINNKLDDLYSEKNRYTHIHNVYGDPASNWVIRHNEQVKQYEEKLLKIQEKVELTDNDKKEIEITNMIHELLLDDYGLTNDSFIENRIPKRTSQEQTELYKRYIKRVPKINIKNNIKYI